MTKKTWHKDQKLVVTLALPCRHRALVLFHHRHAPLAEEERTDRLERNIWWRDAFWHHPARAQLDPAVSSPVDEYPYNAAPNVSFARGWGACAVAVASRDANVLSSFIDCCSRGSFNVCKSGAM